MAGPEDALISGVTVARGALWAATDRGLWKRAGDGSVWQHVAAPGLHEHAAVMVEAHSGGAGILAADARGGVFLSRDAGTTWEDASGPWGGQTLLRVMAMPGPNAADAGDLTALTLTPTRAGHYGIFVWRRSAGEWSNIASLATDVPAVLAARSYRSGVFLATQHRVVRLYEDAGEGGTAAAQHFFPEGDQVTALCATGDDSDALWAATSAGLFRTVDAGATWRHMAMLPDARPVVWLRQEGECLAVVTLGGQVWRIRLVDAE
jgi:ligand-binding sensor domain-containing protein